MKKYSKKKIKVRQNRSKKFFNRNYSLCFKFFREIKWYVVFTLGTLAFFFLVGFAFPYFFRERIFEFVMQMKGIIEGKSALWLIKFIFFNNLQASFVAMVTGIFFGIVPFASIVVNGYVIGFVARESVIVEGIWILFKLVPHGIFELPAIILSISIGLKIGRDLFGQEQKVKYNLREGLRFFFFVILPLLLIAAIIEGSLIARGI